MNQIRNSEIGLDLEMMNDKTIEIKRGFIRPRVALPFDAVLFWRTCVLFFGTMAATSHADPIRLERQAPWVTQGQPAMVLKHTNIPQLTGEEVDFVDLSYGGPLNQSSLAEKVDDLLTADRPAIALHSRTGNYVVVARRMYEP